MHLCEIQISMDWSKSTQFFKNPWICNNMPTLLKNKTKCTILTDHPWRIYGTKSLLWKMIWKRKTSSIYPALFVWSRPQSIQNWVHAPPVFAQPTCPWDLATSSVDVPTTTTVACSPNTANCLSLLGDKSWVLSTAAVMPAAVEAAAALMPRSNLRGWA